MVPSDQWGECPPGLIRSMIERKRRRQQMGDIRRAAGIVACFLLLATVTGVWFSRADAVEQISCAQAVELFARYRDGLLDNALRRRVKVHLRDCTHCRDRFEQEYSPEAQTPGSSEGDLVLAALTAD